MEKNLYSWYTCVGNNRIMEKKREKNTLEVIFILEDKTVMQMCEQTGVQLLKFSLIILQANKELLSKQQ